MKTAVHCRAKFSRIALIVLNLIFLLCGIALLIVGCLFRFGNDQLKEDMKPTFENINISNNNAYDLFFGLSIVFVIAGAFIIIISIFGFIGAACTADLALYIYLVVVGLLVILELAGVVLFFIVNDEIDEAFETGLKLTIDKANNPTSTFYEDSKKSAQYMMKTYECCHVNGTRLQDLGEARDTCGRGAPFQKDCYDAIKEWVGQYSTALIAIGIFAIILQVSMIVMSCVIVRCYKEAAQKVP